MDRDSLDRLRFDRRLQSRRGWIAPEELERYLESLPDVSDKLTTLAAEADVASGAAESGSAPAASPSQAG